MNKTFDEPPIESHSQFDEDILVWDYFKRKKTGTFVEVGANMPQFLSQTWFLEQNGWRGILIEPQSKCCTLLREQRPGSKIVQAACCAPDQKGTLTLHVSTEDFLSSVKKHFDDKEIQYSGTETVQALPLDEILAQGEVGAGTAHPIDYLSIDVEGFELDVLRGFDLKRHQPRLMLIEDHLQSLTVHRHILRHGYKLVRRTGCNNWYIPQADSLPTPLGEKWKLFRKVWLGTPFRAFRLKQKKRKAEGQA